MRFPLWLPALAFLAYGTPLVQGEVEPPPQAVPLVEKKFEQLSSKETSPLGTKALAIAPEKWKHAETDHFIVHFRRATEAQRVVREVEYTLWFVAQSLGATKERYAKKSHVYVFQDAQEWITFRSVAEVPSWSGSFAMGDDLFLHVGGMGEEFDSHTLAHETTHAVVARLYPRQRWPRWLNEGFAEYMGSASQAARKGLWTKGLQQTLSEATLPVAKLVSMEDYPKERVEVDRFYASSQKLVRFLMNSYPKDRFPKFVDAILGGAKFEAALLQVYGDQVQDYAAFTKRYERFVK
ncbi:MAG: peptidase MA family metallohydrolase [Verrucomicrobiota bacterium]